MTPFPKKLIYLVALGLLTIVLTAGPCQLRAALTPFSARDTQRNALNEVRTQVNFLKNATRTALRLPAAGYDMLGQQYQTVCAAYDAFKGTLSPPQFNALANDLADLDAGLGIIRDAFAIYREELDNGRSNTLAFRDLCEVLRDGIDLWLQELNRDCSRARIGRP